MSASSVRRAEVSRGLLALLFAVAFLANGGPGLWVSLTAQPAHVNGMSAVIFVFGLIALAGAVQQFLLSSPAKRGRGTMPPGPAFSRPEDRLRGVEGASPHVATAAPPPSASPPPPPLRRGGEITPTSAVPEHP